MQKLVNKVIAGAKKSKTLFSTDWSNVPVPTLDKSKVYKSSVQSENSSFGRPLSSFSSHSQQQSDNIVMSFNDKSPKKLSKANRKRFSSSSSDEYPPLKKINVCDSQIAYLRDEEKPSNFFSSKEEDYIPVKIANKDKQRKETKKNTAKKTK